MRVRLNSTATLTASFYEDGETALDVGAVTVSVTSDYKNTVVASGTATKVTGPPISYTFALPLAATVAYDRLTVTWTSATQTVVGVVDIVSGFYFDLADLRNMHDLSNMTTYPTARLVAARDWIESVIETAVSTSFVYRYGRVVLNSTGNANAGPIYYDRDQQTLAELSMGATTMQTYRALTLPDFYVSQIIGIDVNGTALTSPELADLATFPGGRIIRKSGGIWGWGYANVDVRYATGFARTPPADLSEAARTAARYHLLSIDGSSSIPSRALSITNEFGNMRLATPDWKHPTGIPDVDAVIMAYAERTMPPVIA